MLILVSGSHGNIGSPLVQALQEDGDEVVRLQRGGPGGPSAAQWDPQTGCIELASAGPLDAVVHLAGESIQGRWTRRKRGRIRDSRVEGTRLLCRALAELDRPPAVLLSASACGYYGNAGEVALPEDAPPGESFLAKVCRDWEAAAAPARAAGIRVIHLRFGMVLHRGGGAFDRMRRASRFGPAAILGDGTQWWSWVLRDDAVAAVRFLLRQPDLDGPVNVTAPEPVRQREMADRLAKRMGKSSLRVRVPRWGLRLAFGRMADDVLLASARCVSAQLERLGFRFAAPDLSTALDRLEPR